MDELLLKIDVKCMDAETVEGHSKRIVMVPFSGETEGKYFSGKVVGTGVDTQTFPKDKDGQLIEGASTLSARYILEGKDFSGADCRIFIENNAGPSGWIPKITTDSNALAYWESANIRSSVEAAENSVSEQNRVTVKIFKCN